MKPYDGTIKPVKALVRSPSAAISARSATPAGIRSSFVWGERSGKKKVATRIKASRTWFSRKKDQVSCSSASLNRKSKVKKRHEIQQGVRTKLTKNCTSSFFGLTAPFGFSR